jgi:translocation and assembly module TamA
VPDFSQPLFAAGAGVRYMTSIAPLRFDIAVPINGRDSDSAFQVYFSIGQAF